MSGIRRSERTWGVMRVRGGKTPYSVEDALIGRLEAKYEATERPEQASQKREFSPVPPRPSAPRQCGTSIGAALLQAVERDTPPLPDFGFLDAIGKRVEQALRAHLPWERWHTEPTRSCPKGREKPEGLYVYDFELPSLQLPSDMACWLAANPRCWRLDRLSRRALLNLATLRKAVLEHVQAAQNERNRKARNVLALKELLDEQP